MAVTVAAPPSPGSAAKDLVRTTKMPGPSPVNFALAISVPPKRRASATRPPSSSSPTTLVSTGRSILADRRAAMSRPS